VLESLREEKKEEESFWRGKTGGETRDDSRLGERLE